MSLIHINVEKECLVQYFGGLLSGLAAALGLGGYLLNWTGFNVELIVQTENTLFWMRFWDVVVPYFSNFINCYINFKILFN